jgi:aerobic-type carbon monoxide dehydrogenase small subunit (CoxS/CutS family)
VLIDGRTARGCLTLAAQVCGHAVDTIEGLTESGGSEPDRIDINMEPARSKKMP